jgi:hypothetical protein
MGKKKRNKDQCLNALDIYISFVNKIVDIQFNVSMLQNIIEIKVDGIKKQKKYITVVLDVFQKLNKNIDVFSKYLQFVYSQWKKCGASKIYFINWVASDKVINLFLSKNTNGPVEKSATYSDHTYIGISKDEDIVDTTGLFYGT